MGRPKLVVLPDDPVTLKAAELYRNGATLLEASRAVYMSTTGLKRRFDALGIPIRRSRERKLSPENPLTKKAVELYQNGATLTFTATAVGLSRGGLRYRFKVLGVPIRKTTSGRKRIPPEIAEAIKREYIPNKNGFLKLAKKYGVSTTTVQNYVKKR